MTKYLMLIAVALAVGFAPAPSPGPGKQGPDDHNAIQGEWRLTYAAIGDRVAEEDEDSKDVWTITKTHVVVRGTKEVAYRLDARKRPRRIEWALPADDEPLTLPGIYELKGDELRICVAHPESDRPEKFEKGEDHNFFVLKRVKKKK